MGCGGSKEEATGQPAASSRSPAQKAMDQSDTDSDIEPRPVALTAAQANRARAAPTPCAPVLDPRAKKPDGGVSWANRATAPVSAPQQSPMSHSALLTRCLAYSNPPRRRADLRATELAAKPRRP
jgi:hypothetical protein